jgi:heat shock protein HslJ
MILSRAASLALYLALNLGAYAFAQSAPPSGMPGASASATPSASASGPASAESAHALSSVTWSILTLEGAKLALPAGAKAPSLRFDAAEKRVTGTTGCNVIVGSYDVQGRSLKFSPLATTRMACAPPLDGIESRFLRALEKTDGYRIDRDGSELELRDGDSVVATFKVVR